MNEYEKEINDFIDKHGTDAFLDCVKISLYKTGHRSIHNEPESLSEIELRTVDWLVANWEGELKDFFLSDLSWANNQEERDQAFVNFFTKRTGKRVLEQLPEDIKNYVLAKSL